LAEDIRAKRITVLRAISSSFRASGDVDRLIEVGLRLVEQDPDGEEVRLDLVAALVEAGRLGEAGRPRRRERTVAAGMVNDVHKILPDFSTGILPARTPAVSAGPKRP